VRTHEYRCAGQAGGLSRRFSEAAVSSARCLSEGRFTESAYASSQELRHAGRCAVVRAARQSARVGASVSGNAAVTLPECYAPPSRLRTLFRHNHGQEKRRDSRRFATRSHIELSTSG